MVIGKPPYERPQSVGFDPIDSPAALRPRADNSRGLHELQMLNDRGTCNRQSALELAGGARHMGNAVEDDDPNRVPKQAEQAEHAPQLDSCHPPSWRFTLPVSQQSWGRSTRIPLPGGGSLGLHEPRHARP
jgi:hypothetical protein